MKKDGYTQLLKEMVYREGSRINILPERIIKTKFGSYVDEDFSSVYMMTLTF